MAKRRRRRSRNSRRRRIRNAIRITLFFLIVVAIIGGIILLVSKLINKGGETGDIGSDAAIEQPVGQEQEEKQGFFAYFLFYCGDRNLPVFVASGTFAALG